LLVVACLVGCGGGASTSLEDRDPRCVSACTDDLPEIDGAGDVCSSASQSACLDECEARIAGVASLCASCLVEDACFDPSGCDDVVIINDCDSNGQCTITGRNDSCSYQADNEAARVACEKQVNPRREVACEAEFRSTSECSSECAN
jgi:hypothetical protein